MWLTSFQHSACVGHFQGEEAELQQKAAGVMQLKVAMAVLMKQEVVTRLRQWVEV